MPQHTILIIDYEPRSIKQLREPLESAGYAVEVSTDGVSGIKAFHDLKPDLTLLEAMLPKRHGFEVCQELKKTAHGLKTPIVIVTSVYKGRKYRTQALHHYGANEYLEKPIEAELLLNTVQRLLRQSPGASSPVSGPTGASDATPSADPMEIEIMERLDEILPGDGSKKAAPPAEGSGTRPAKPRASSDKVVSFDPERIRKRRNERSQTVPVASAAGNTPARTPAVAESSLPIGEPVRLTASEPAAVPSEAAADSLPRSVEAPARRDPRFWIIVALLVTLGVVLLFAFGPL